MIPEQEKIRLHYRIGRILLKDTKPEDISERIFNLVDQLNIGRELISSKEERDKLARLNLDAAQKAKSSSAY